MSSTMVHQKEHFCASKDGESSLSNDCKTENHSAANDDENHSQTEGRDVTRETSDSKSPFVCWICQEGFPSTAALKVHGLSHSAPYVCSVCRMEFPEMKNLKIHVVAAHTEKRLHVCGECGKAFPSTSQLKTHLAVHSEKKPYKCALCNRGFTQLHSLKRHCEQHTVLPVDVRDLHNEMFSPRRRKRGPNKDPKEHSKIPKKAGKPCFWDNLRKGFSKSYLKDRRQAMEKKLKIIKSGVN